MTLLPLFLNYQYFNHALGCSRIELINDFPAAVIVHRSGEVTAGQGQWSHYIHSQVAKSHEGSVWCLLFILPRTPVHEMVLDTIRVGLLTSVNLTR